MPDLVSLTLHPIGVERPKDKQYLWVRFRDQVRAGEYKGGQAMTWSTTVGTLVEKHIADHPDEPLVFVVEPQEGDKASWSPTIVKVADAQGTVLYDKATDPAQQKRGNRGGGGGGRPALTPEQMAEERRSIEAQSASTRAGGMVQSAVALLGHLVPYAPDGSELLTPDGAVAFVRRAVGELTDELVDSTRKVADALRSAAQQGATGPSQPSRAGRPGERRTAKADEAGGVAAVESSGTDPSSAEDGPGGPVAPGSKGDLLNQAVARWGLPRKGAEAWNRAYPAAPVNRLEDLSEDQLRELLALPVEAA